MDGEFDKHQSGNAVSGAGDVNVNGDGFADLQIGAHKANPNGAYSGRNYIITETILQLLLIFVQLLQMIILLEPRIPRA